MNYTNSFSRPKITGSACRYYHHSRTWRHEETQQGWLQLKPTTRRAFPLLNFPRQVTMMQSIAANAVGLLFVNGGTSSPFNPKYSDVLIRQGVAEDLSKLVDLWSHSTGLWKPTPFVDVTAGAVSVAVMEQSLRSELSFIAIGPEVQNVSTISAAVLAVCMRSSQLLELFFDPNYSFWLSASPLLRPEPANFVRLLHPSLATFINLSQIHHSILFITMAVMHPSHARRPEQAFKLFQDLFERSLRTAENAGIGMAMFVAKDALEVTVASNVGFIKTSALTLAPKVEVTLMIRFQKHAEQDRGSVTSTT